jgi:hypothetical protein
MDIMVIAKRFKSFLLLIFSFKSDRVYNKYNNTYRTVTMLWYTFLNTKTLPRLPIMEFSLVYCQVNS